MHDHIISKYSYIPIMDYLYLLETDDLGRATPSSVTCVMDWILILPNIECQRKRETNGRCQCRGHRSYCQKSTALKGQYIECSSLV